MMARTPPQPASSSSRQQLRRFLRPPSTVRESAGTFCANSVRCSCRGRSPGCFGEKIDLHDRAVGEEGHVLHAGIGGTSARAPTSRKILSACSRRLFADTVRGAVMRRVHARGIRSSSPRSASEPVRGLLDHRCPCASSLPACRRARAGREAVVAARRATCAAARARDQRLGRDAAVVHAGAEPRSLRSMRRGLQSSLSRPRAQRRRSLPGADDDRVRRSGVIAPSSRRRSTAARR